MFYTLYNLKEAWSPLNVFQYITFRTGGAFLTSLLIILMFGNLFIQCVKKWEITQSVREYGPQSHLIKSGTPTMGGLLILFSLLVSTLLWARLDNRFIWLVLISAVYLGLLGFVDDFKKLVLKHPSKGLSQATKIIFQMVWALGVMTYLYFDPPNPDYASKVQVPYLKNVFIDLGSLIIFLGLLVLAGYPLNQRNPRQAPAKAPK